MQTVRPIKPVLIVDDDDAIIDERAAAAFLGGIHPDSIPQLPNPPKRIRLTPRRSGFRLGDVRRSPASAWLPPKRWRHEYRDY